MTTLTDRDLISYVNSHSENDASISSRTFEFVQSFVKPMSGLKIYDQDLMCYHIDHDNLHVVYTEYTRFIKATCEQYVASSPELDELKNLLLDKLKNFDDIKFVCNVGPVKNIKCIKQTDVNHSLSSNQRNVVLTTNRNTQELETICVNNRKYEALKTNNCHFNNITIDRNQDNEIDATLHLPSLGSGRRRPSILISHNKELEIYFSSTDFPSDVESIKDLEPLSCEEDPTDLCVLFINKDEILDCLTMEPLQKAMELILSKYEFDKLKAMIRSIREKYRAKLDLWTIHAAHLTTDPLFYSVVDDSGGEPKDVIAQTADCKKADAIAYIFYDVLFHCAAYTYMSK